MDNSLFGGGAAAAVSSTARTYSSTDTVSLTPTDVNSRIVAGLEPTEAGVRGAAPKGGAIVVTAGPDGHPPLAAALRETLSRIYHALGRGKARAAEEATERALAAVGGLVGGAGGVTASGVEIRIVSQSVALKDADGGRQSGVFLEQLALEVGVVRSGSVRADDTRLLKFDGREIELEEQARRDGLATGRYIREETVPRQLDARTRKALDAAREAVEWIRAVQQALAAYRSGDLQALKSLIDGTLSQTRGVQIGV